MATYRIAKVKVKGGTRHRIYWKTPQGTPKQKQFMTIGDAKRWIEQHPTFTHVSQDAEKARISYEELAEIYLDALRIGLDGKPAREATTINGYRQKQRAHVYPVIGSKLVGRLTKDDIRSLMVSLLESCGTRITAKHTFTTTKQILRWAMTEGYILNFPAEGLAISMDKREVAKIKVWTDAEMEKLKATAKAMCSHRLQWTRDAWSDRYYLLFCVLCCTGVRISELLGMRWEDLSPCYSEISIVRRIQIMSSGMSQDERVGPPKTKNGTRTIALPSFLSEMLREAHEKSEHDYIFCTSSGKYLEYGNLRRRMWLKLIAEAGVSDHGFHSIRHYFASSLIAQKVDLMTLSRTLGHHSVSFTIDTYGHLLDGMAERRKEAAEAMGQGF